MAVARSRNWRAARGPLWRAAPVVAASVVAVAAMGAVLMSVERAPVRPEKLPPFDLPALALRGIDGAPVELRALRGQVVVASFVFLGCGDLCPLLNRRMASLRARWTRPEDPRLLSFSVNPEDGPKEIDRYLHANHLGPDPRWLWLAADRQTLPPLAVGMGLAADEREVASGFLDLAPRLYLIDRAGVVRGRYDATRDSEMERLARDAATPREEAPR